ncbi:glycosyltransferase [bacterium]|nr:glycosyltransferase [bacterium]
MANVDLHVHSKYSNHPAEWFLQRIGASESYTEPEELYATAKRNGMRFVTITDHNSIEGALELAGKYPDDCFVSVEATTYFPEDDCKIHLLVYGIDEDVFLHIQRLRSNIYDLRDFLRERKLPHSVAHATYSINGKLTVEHIEKLILLFDVFEVLNGSRNRLNNYPLEHVLKSLTPRRIDTLHAKHRIDPFSDTPWVKGFTGGSDDHSGLFIARAYTQAPGHTVRDFLESIVCRNSLSAGIYSNYTSLAFAIYKIAYEFSRRKSIGLSQSLAAQLTEKLFDRNAGRRKSRLSLRLLARFKRRSASMSVFEDLYREVLDGISNHESVDTKLEFFYDKISVVCDEFFRQLISSFEKSLAKGDIFDLLKTISLTLPGIFLTIPFFSTQKHFSDGKKLVDALLTEFDIRGSSPTGSILWFTDTLNDLNGVSVVVRKIGWLSSVKDKDIIIVTSLPPDSLGDDLPPNVVNLPYFYETALPNYENLTVRFPSLLDGLKLLDKYEPDAIYLSTPGPVGLFGLLLSKITNTLSIGVFHTDFTLQVREIFGDASVESLTETYLKVFYSYCDEIRVPSKEYMRILDERGYDRTKMTVLKRGIETDIFSPRPGAKEALARKYGIRSGFTMLYAGRVSKDKNLVFLITIFRNIKAIHPALNLVIAGDGPDLDELRRLTADEPCIVFTGRLNREELPELYSGADVFVFPSTTDTFGMVVIEAQSCGLPAVVTDRGGPKELVVHGKTGFIVQDSSAEPWERTLNDLLALWEHQPERYRELCANARANVLENANWDTVLDELATAGRRFRTTSLSPVPS